MDFSFLEIWQIWTIIFIKLLLYTFFRFKIAKFATKKKSLPFAIQIKNFLYFTLRNAYFYSSPLMFCPMPLGPTNLKAKDPQIRERCLGSNPSPIHKDPIKTFGIIPNVFGWQILKRNSTIVEMPGPSIFMKGFSALRKCTFSFHLVILG